MSGVTPHIAPSRFLPRLVGALFCALGKVEGSGFGTGAAQHGTPHSDPSVAGRKRSSAPRVSFLRPFLRVCLVPSDGVDHVGLAPAVVLQLLQLDGLVDSFLAPGAERFFVNRTAAAERRALAVDLPPQASAAAAGGARPPGAQREKPGGREGGFSAFGRRLCVGRNRGRRIGARQLAVWRAPRRLFTGLLCRWLRSRFHNFTLAASWLGRVRVGDRASPIAPRNDSGGPASARVQQHSSARGLTCRKSRLAMPSGAARRASNRGGGAATAHAPCASRSRDTRVNFLPRSLFRAAQVPTRSGRARNRHGNRIMRASAAAELYDCAPARAAASAPEAIEFVGGHDPRRCAARRLTGHGRNRRTLPQTWVDGSGCPPKSGSCRRRGNTAEARRPASPREPKLEIHCRDCQAPLTEEEVARQLDRLARSTTLLGIRRSTVKVGRKIARQYMPRCERCVTKLLEP